MAAYRAVAVKLSECQRLIDLSSIKRDFERCKAMCEKLVPSAYESGFDGTVIDALATAIPVVYARPFNGGVRTRVNGLLVGFNDADLKLHSQILEMRSKFSAHSVNGMEQEIVRVWLNPEQRGGRRINNVNAASNVLLALSGNEYAHLIVLCVKALNWVDDEFNAESSTLPDAILQHYSLDELYEMEDQWTQSSGLEGVHKGRPKLNKS